MGYVFLGNSQKPLEFPPPTPRPVPVAPQPATSTVPASSTESVGSGTVPVVVPPPIKPLPPKPKPPAPAPTPPPVPHANGYTGMLLAGSADPLLDFNQEDYNVAREQKKIIILYFFASWCPICKDETVNALYPAFNQLTDGRIVGFRIHFNDNTASPEGKALARTHGVTYQHTKVIIKEDNSRFLKSPEQWDLARYMSEINSALQ